MCEESCSSQAGRESDAGWAQSTGAEILPWAMPAFEYASRARSVSQRASGPLGSSPGGDRGVRTSTASIAARAPSRERHRTEASPWRRRPRRQKSYPAKGLLMSRPAAGPQEPGTGPTTRGQSRMPRPPR